MDCHALDLPDDSFDVAAPQFGVMLVPDQPRALREMVRVTRAGGRVLVSPTAPLRSSSSSTSLSARSTRRPGVPGPARRSAAARVPGLRSGSPAAEADPGRTEERQIDQSAERPTFASGQEIWDWVLYGNPFPGMLVADLTENQRATLRRVLDGMLRERAGADGRAVLRNAVNIGVGTA